MKQFIVKNSPDIFTLALSVYGSIEETVKLCNDNNLTIVNTGVKPATVIEYDSTLVVPITPVQAMQKPQPAPQEILSFKSVYGQNQFDVVLNMYGTIEQYVKMLVDNNVDNYYIPSGKVYTFALHLIKDVNIYNETTAKGIIFSTGTPTYIVFSEEDEKTIFISEDGSTEFTPEP